MEIGVDFGLFELAAIAGVTAAVRFVRRNLPRVLSATRRKLGRCILCITLTGLGLTVAAVVGVFLPMGTSVILRDSVLGVQTALSILAVLHVGAAIGHLLTRRTATHRRVGPPGQRDCGCRRVRG